MIKGGCTILVFALLASAVLGSFEPDAIFVDVNAPPGGNGTSPATAYRTIREAVTDANARIAGPVIHVAEGTYVELPNITITRDGVRLLGSTALRAQLPEPRPDIRRHVSLCDERDLRDRRDG